MGIKCLFCGDLERVEVWEVWEDGAFQVDTCCEGLRESVLIELDEFGDDHKARAAWIAALPVSDFGDDVGIEAVCGHSLRRVVANDGHLLIDWNLTVHPIAQADAKAFVAEHHRHCPPPAGWRYGAAVRNGNKTIGVIMVGRPVARAIDHTKVVEVNRLCVRTDVPQQLVWNACSLLYGWAAREAKKRGFSRIITYTMAHEPGTTLRAVGWQQDGEVKARRRGWDSDARPRAGHGTHVAKTRWARQLAAA